MKYSLTFNMLGLTFWHSNMASVWTVLSLCLVRVWHKLTQMPQTHTKTGSHPPTNANMSWVTKQQSNTFIITPAYMPADFEFKQRFTNWMKIALYYQGSHTFHSVFENRRQPNWNLTNVVWVNCAFFSVCLYNTQAWKRQQHVSAWFTEMIIFKWCARTYSTWR